MRICIVLCLLTFMQKVSAQSTYLNLSSDDYFQLQRLDILQGKVNDSLYTLLNGISRKDAVHFVENYLIENEEKIDSKERYILEKFISNNCEWARTPDACQESEYPLFKTIYYSKTNMLQYRDDKLFFALNPIIYYRQMGEQGNLKQNLFFNARGIEARGKLGHRIGFYTTLTDNQERGPLYHQYFVNKYQAVPGYTFYKDFKLDANTIAKKGYAHDYLYAAGYVDAEVLKDVVNVTFGTDRFQIGDGYRSLLLSDFGANYTFLKLNTRFWKFNYQNLFMELTNQYFRGADRLLPRKYASMHTLSTNLFKWLQVSFFEAVVYGRADRFDFRYLNPIIFYRSVEQTSGSPDNALVGLNYKINTGLKAILYGQVMLDEFSFGQLKKNNGWWANKYAMQLGVKFADPFGLKNMLLQVEANYVRPFTYSYSDSITDYSNYNQPLAHPYGANFAEIAVIAQYLAGKNTILRFKTFYNKQGRDTLSDVSFGGNIFKDYNKRNAEEGIRIFNGYSSTVIFADLGLSYELRRNLFFDLGFTYRREKSSHIHNPSWNAIMGYAAIRLNTVRRQYDY